MWPLPVRDLFFVGKAAERQLNRIGIRTIGDLAHTDQQVLSNVMKKHGEVLWRYANGMDDSPVEVEPADAKGYSNSTTVSFDITDAADAKSVLRSLTENVCRRLRRDGVRARTITVQIRYNDLTRTSHQSPLPAASNITKEIEDAACQLFDEMWDKTPIRLLGVAATNITKGDEGRQMSLFDTTDYAKLEKLDQAFDSIRSKYGTGAIKRGTDLEK